MNQALGNVGKTVFYTDPVDANPVNQTESLKDLVADMRAGKVDMLVILGGNPAYDAPADFGFADALKNTNIPFRVHLGLYQNETAELCQWHVNEAHYLEAWGDARAYDGTVSIVQPLIAPLYNGKSAYEIVALLSGQADAKRPRHRSGYWKKQHSGADFDAFWRKSLHDGWVEGTAFAPKQLTREGCRLPAASARRRQGHRNQFPPRSFHLRRPLLQQRLAAGTAQADEQAHLGQSGAHRSQDGRAHGDLKPKTWSSSNSTAKRLTAPVWIQAGHPDNSVTVFLGYGRRRAGRAGTGAGFDMYPLRYQRDALDCTTGVDDSQDRRYLQAGLHPGLPDHGYAAPARVRWCAPRPLRSTAKNRTSRREEEPRAGLDALHSLIRTTTSLTPGA